MGFTQPGSPEIRGAEVSRVDAYDIGEEVTHIIAAAEGVPSLMPFIESANEGAKNDNADRPDTGETRGAQE